MHSFAQSLKLLNELTLLSPGKILKRALCQVLVQPGLELQVLLAGALIDVERKIVGHGYRVGTTSST